MKQIQFLCLFVFSLFFSIVYADGTYNEVEDPTHYDTYMGVNFKQNWIKPRSGWDNLFVKAEPGFNVYFGWRFHPNFGAELGYEWTDNKPKIFAVQNGTSLLGILNNSGTTVNLTSKLRFKTGALDINAFIPLCALPLGEEIIPEGIISVGVAGMKPSIKIYSDATTAAALAFSNPFTTMNGRSKTMFRAGLGVQALVIESFGVRLLWRFESTSLLRARNSVVATNPATRAIFKDGNSLALGLFFKF